ncbi:MAG TPA: acetaldehyde dehydrogenase (acetylating) [Candidatus Mailhella excrementigallinarum]|nr:MAG: acetaldehyde dehydrogenase (acetylating) [Desulfovibrionaceae bacterium]HIV65133.1 acetaldehyde dehydrogenase (acetylating) [Candidatus Mailhella excrementigallinarum]
MVDKDLLSIQEARALVRAARAAQAEFSQLGQERIDAVVKAVSEAAAAQAEALGVLAHEETGYGKPQDKKIKNLLASEKVYAAIKDMKTVGILREDTVNRITEIAVPVGVIAGIIPSTNPTSTVIYKSLISLKAGNAIVFTPHPSAKKCIGRTVEIIKEALHHCGVSTDLVSCISIPTIEGSAELMKIADLILATGGPGMVKAAYSSGTPALGVGAGNVPAYIERSANIEDAVAKIMASKTFDNGTICASEQSIVTESVIAAQVKRALIAQGGFFLEGENLTRVKAVMERGNGSMNPAIVGRDAMTIARIAGIEVPAGTRLLISDEQGVGAKFPFSKEKLTALLGFYVVNDWHQACELCHALLHNCGIGHSLAIHSNNEDVIREFGLKKPVSRILVNTPSTQGGVGLTTALFPSFTLGCGAVGGSATSDNVTPMNLLNIRRVAYDLGSSMCRHHDCHAEAPKSCCSAASSCANAAGTSSIDINAITSLIVAELKKVM